MFKLNSILDEDTRKALSLSAKAIKNRSKYIELVEEGYTHERMFLYGLIELSRTLVVLFSRGRYVGDFGPWWELERYFSEKDKQEKLSKENAD